MSWFHKQITLAAKPRGFHLITDELVQALPQLRDYQVGQCQLLLQHTSASLTLNENADPTVRSDLARFSDKLIPDGTAYFAHDYEGDDDMPAHVKSSLFGVSLLLPIINGRLALGTWQGIYLGEHRDHGGARRIQVILQGVVG